MEERILEVQDLKTYFLMRRGVVKAVDGVSFTLGKGETLGIVGESGCGKSMTALSILRLVPQPSGRIVGGKIIFEGEDLLQKSERDMRRIRGRKICMILQDPMTSLDPTFTVGNQLTETIAIHQEVKSSSLREKAISILKRVGIASPDVMIGQYPHQFSGGMRQRVVGAIVISCQPRVIIADEPTTSLDATIQAQYLEFLKDIQQELGFSLIFISHDLGIIAAMCDRVAVMYAGKIVESGPLREIFNNPLHPYTSALPRSLPKIERRAERLFAIDGQPPTLMNLPSGCSFAPRCNLAKERCRKKNPPLTSAGDGHDVSCGKGD